MDIHGSEGTQMVDGSKTHMQDNVLFFNLPIFKRNAEYGAEKVASLSHYSIWATNKKTY